jgi:hypothetical protein
MVCFLADCTSLCDCVFRNDPNYDSDEDQAVLIAPNAGHSRLQEEVAAYTREVSSTHGGRAPGVCSSRDLSTPIC